MNEIAINKMSLTILNAAEILFLELYQSGERHQTLDEKGALDRRLAALSQLLAPDGDNVSDLSEHVILRLRDLRATVRARYGETRAEEDARMLAKGERS